MFPKALAAVQPASCVTEWSRVENDSIFLNAAYGGGLSSLPKELLSLSPNCAGGLNTRG
jgi:hypothetical protein